MDDRKLNKEKIPRHIAIIMDGNGRWAKNRALPRIVGHRYGMESVREVVTACRELGVEVLTLYAFSAENWKRPRREIRALMNLLKKYIRAEIDALNRNQIRVHFIGDIDKLPDDVKPLLDEAERTTAGNSGMILNLALSYGGRQEIVRAAARLAEAVVRGKVATSEITEAVFAQYLYTAGQPDPDLLIRTSGEQRVSNFLLWQIGYAELYFTSVLWPDFRRKHLYQALLEYQKRKRRFGLTDEQLREA
ncbi:MAG: isoprenyl transferase [Desulfobacterota bacterium]|nr:isoprenyl transferase [Thermodesulfobacteriota bacterium]